MVPIPYPWFSTTTRVPAGISESLCTEPSTESIFQFVPRRTSDFRQRSQCAAPVRMHVTQPSKTMEKLFPPSAFARKPSIVATCPVRRERVRAAASALGSAKGETSSYAVALVLDRHASAVRQLLVTVVGALAKDNLPAQVAELQRLAAAVAVLGAALLAGGAVVEHHRVVVGAEQVVPEAVDRRHLAPVRA